MATLVCTLQASGWVSRDSISTSVDLTSHSTQYGSCWRQSPQPITWLMQKPVFPTNHFAVQWHCYPDLHSIPCNQFANTINNSQFLCLVLLSWPYPGSVKRGACTRKIPVFFPSLSLSHYRTECSQPISWLVQKPVFIINHLAGAATQNITKTT